VLATVGDFPYKVVYLLHLLAVIVGFGSSFVYPLAAAQARKRGPDAPKESFAVTHTMLDVSKMITTPLIYAAGAFGLILIFLSGESIKFSQVWISIAFTLFIIAALFAAFVHTPNLKAMDSLQARIAEGNVTPQPGGPPQEVVELQERGKKAGMFGGILHLLFLLLLIDMIWQPGRF
jgi:hypothetical protein